MTGERVLELVLLGPAQQQGSVKTFVPERNGQPIRGAGGRIIVNVTSDNKELKAWRKRLAEAARTVLADVRTLDDRPAFPIEGAGFTVSEVAYFKRPESHWGTGRNAHRLKDWAPARPIVQSKNADSAPDVDKLLRAALDALTGVVWKDDSQVTDATPRKRYAVPGPDGDGVLAVLQVWVNDAQTAEDLPDEERVRFVAAPMGQESLALPLEPVLPSVTQPDHD